MKQYHAIGLMSGTSLDGLDLCYAQFSIDPNEGWSYKLLKAKTIPYSPNWRRALYEAVHLEPEALLELNVSYGMYLGEQLKAFRQELGKAPIDLVASHGHTVFHQPQRHFTLQIGDGRAIKHLNPFPTVYDFRSQDVLLGGQGAPLVPIGDHLLFNSYHACLNLGGFSNISYVKQGVRLAFDIAPVNIVLNALANQLGLPYDDQGKIARAGTVDLQVLEALNSLEYYTRPGPKSLGVEWVTLNIWPLLEGLTPECALSTFTRHAAQQLSNVFEQNKLVQILVTGGGAYNRFLLEQTAALCKSTLVLASKEVIEFKEALIFAFMGVLRLLEEPNILSSVTGSPKDHCSGLLV